MDIIQKGLCVSPLISPLGEIKPIQKRGLYVSQQIVPPKQINVIWQLHSYVYLYFNNRAIVKVYFIKNTMARYFNMLELCHSDTADRLHIDNRPSKEIEANLNELMEVLDSIRIHYNKAIKVTSGYRCPQLNKSIGGVSNSLHLRGRAADLVPMRGSIDEFIKSVKNWGETTKIPFDKIIIEKNSKGKRWIHFQLKGNNGEQRHQIFNLYVS